LFNSRAALVTEMRSDNAAWLAL